MHDLEDELKPTLENLIPGNSFTLTEWAQRRLATWAAKTAMTAEFIEPDTAGISFEHREYLRLSRDPPRHFHIWAGHFIGDRHQSRIFHHSGYFTFGHLEPGAEKTVPKNTQATLICIGRAVLQIIHSDVAGLQFQLNNEEISKLRRIWPPIGNNLDWPPSRSLDDAEIARILQGLHAIFEDD